MFSDLALWYNDLMNPSTACFEAVYSGAPGIPKNDAILPRITMDFPVFAGLRARW